MTAGTDRARESEGGQGTGQGTGNGPGHGPGHGPGREAHGSGHGAGGDAAHGLAHVLPLKVLAVVWVALLILTVVTVGVTRFDLGSMNLWVAMAIATVKGGLVALYFMHLRYDRPFNAVIFITALLFVGLFVGLSMTDTEAYQPDLIPGYAPAMEQGGR